SRVALVVNIDHHGTNAGFGQYNYVDVQAAAVGEQIYELLRSMEVDISPAIATCLYTAIVTDTGSFRYESTRESTFRVAAELVRLGAKPAQVAENAFETRSLSSARLLGRALETLELTPDGKVAWLVISRAALEETGASDEETEGIINYARAIRGVEVGLLFRETGDGKVRVSLRSRHQVDVSRVASHFDGGGHPRAAGCTLSLPLNEAREKVITAVRGALADS
ncbi:MAG: bifunctional oligoribonuclease/PAP phosphatase NrnA, partial [Firmicutes bacterium]|nr:bifunctional oligoribonuclease/PAP phosphatase NrnA [Bacillota bacterium]